MTRIRFAKPATIASELALLAISPPSHHRRRNFTAISMTTLLFACFAFVAAIVAPRAAQATPLGGLTQTFVKSAPTNFARFGEGLAGVGGDVVVGGEDAHAAYVYSASSGALLGTIPSPTPTASDAFGYSAAGSASDVFIGAPDDSSVSVDAGVVYEFNPANGNLVQSFRAAGSAEFGYAVASSGTKLLVGGLGFSSSPPVYLYDTTTGKQLLAISDPVQNVKDNFGTSIAFLGNNILIGAAADQTSSLAGVAYLFNGSTGALLHTFQDPNSGGSNWFGLSVAAVNGNILIGAPRDSTQGEDSGAAYLFNGTTGALMHTYFDPNGTGLAFGTAVASVGSDTLIAADNYMSSSDNEGAFYGFGPSNQLLWTTTNPDSSSESDFGFYVGTVGNNFLVGAPLDGSVGIDGGIAYEFQGPAVPEPATFVLLAVGLLALSGLTTVRRRSRRFDSGL